MADLLVPLYGLAEPSVPEGYILRRPMASESSLLQSRIEENFSSGWSSEVLPALGRTPPSMRIALCSETLSLAGFCAWDCTALGFLGPVGVLKGHRGKGLGRGLVLAVLHDMLGFGYGYAVVGDAGPEDFFRGVCSAVVIENSEPGIYRRAVR